MAEVLRDDVDYAAYARMTDAKVKVRRSIDFKAELDAEFETTEGRPKWPTLTGKLAHQLYFAPGETTVWAGYSGHRKSMYTCQVALDLMTQGRKVLMASMEMPPKKTLSRMLRQAFGKSDVSARERDEFHRWTDGKLWLFDHMGNVEPSLMLGVCRYFRKELKGTDAFIDNFLMLCESEEHSDKQKELASAIVRMGIEDDLHMHVVAHCRKGQTGEDKPPTKHDVRGSAAITDLAHNVVTVWLNKPKFAKLQQNAYDEAAHKEGDFRVSVEKQRNGVFEGSAQLWFCQSSLRFTDSRMAPVGPYIQTFPRAA